MGSNSWKELDDLVVGNWGNWGICWYTVLDRIGSFALDMSRIRSSSILVPVGNFAFDMSCTRSVMVVGLPFWALVAILLRMSWRELAPAEPAGLILPLDELCIRLIATPPLVSIVVGTAFCGGKGAPVGKVTSSVVFLMGFPVMQSRDSSDILTSLAMQPSFMILQFGRGVKTPALTPIL